MAHDIPSLTVRLEVLPGARVIDKLHAAQSFGFDGVALPGRHLQEWLPEVRACLRDCPLPLTSISLGFAGSLAQGLNGGYGEYLAAQSAQAYEIGDGPLSDAELATFPCAYMTGETPDYKPQLASALLSPASVDAALQNSRRAHARACACACHVVHAGLRRCG